MKRKKKRKNNPLFSLSQFKSQELAHDNAEVKGMRYFHGVKGKKNSYEGWYFKHQGKNHSLALIPSICTDESGKPSAQVQIVTEKKSWTVPISMCEFNSEEDQLSVRMDNSYFTERGCTLNIHVKGLDLTGRIEYDELMYLDKDIMGPFRFMPKMETRHGIVSLYHTLSGSIKINKETWDFNQGIGYVEMDWGTTFPKQYVWTHAAWKDTYENCIVAAAAQVPVLNFNFNGFIGCLLYQGQQVVIASYFGAKVKEMSSEKIVVEQKQMRLEIELLDHHPVELLAPEQGKMVRKTTEHLRTSVQYRFFQNNGCIFDVVQEEASFESFLK